MTQGNRAGVTTVAGVFVFIVVGNFLPLGTTVLLAALATFGTWMLTAPRQPRRDD